MKRIIAFIILLSLVFALPAETITHSSFSYKYESYEEEEFPLWTIELRRAETLFFGSLVFTLPVSAAVVGVMSSSGLLDMDMKKNTMVASISAIGLSLVVTGIDWILGRMGE